MKVKIIYQTDRGERCIPLIVSTSTNWNAVRQAAQMDGALDMELVNEQIVAASA